MIVFVSSVSLFLFLLLLFLLLLFLLLLLPLLEQPLHMGCMVDVRVQDNWDQQSQTELDQVLPFSQIPSRRGCNTELIVWRYTECVCVSVWVCVRACVCVCACSVLMGVFSWIHVDNSKLLIRTFRPCWCASLYTFVT